MKTAIQKMNTTRKGLFLMVTGLIGCLYGYFADPAPGTVTPDRIAACETALRKRFSHSPEVIEREIGKCSEMTFMVAMTAQSAEQAAREIADANNRELSDSNFRNFGFGIAGFIFLVGCTMVILSYKKNKES